MLTKIEATEQHFEAACTNVYSTLGKAEETC